jgi:hypothetical protein
MVEMNTVEEAWWLFISSPPPHHVLDHRVLQKLFQVEYKTMLQTTFKHRSDR